MALSQLITRVVDDGIAAAREDYQHSPIKLEGAIEGFEACRGKNIDELRQLLVAATKRKGDAYHDDRDRYWYHVCYHAEIEWVCNVVSAALHNQNMPTIVTPTMRGYMKAAEIIGVQGYPSLADYLETRKN